MKPSRQRQSKVAASAVSGSFVLNPVTAVVLSVFAITSMSPACAAEQGDAPKFDTTFLQIDTQRVDIARLARGNIVTPGDYSVDISVNGNHVARDTVRFVATREGENARACLTRKMLETFGLDFATLPRNEAQRPSKESADACVDVSTLIPEATVDFDFTEQKLSISIPQKFMRNMARGYVSPELWDKGVNAGFLSYNANVYQTNAGNMHSVQEYLGLNAGVNIGSWHFRHQSSTTAATGQPTQFDNIATYVQHDITKLRAQATLGDAQTTGDMFDSVSFRGAQIATDDRMLPESLRGYAPVVRGTAESNARVTVRQNGQVIYETNVSPGPFEIRDLYATGYGGNLDVTVTEADGRTKSFTVPYAAVAQSLRPGTTRFAFTAGQLRDDSLQTKPVFGQITMQRGLTNLVTIYGGGIASNGYIAADLGAAFNTKYGALAADVTTARTQIPGSETQQGQSLHIGYSKFIDLTDTNIALGAYRYSTAGYLGFDDAARVRDVALHDGDVNAAAHERGRLQLTVNQNLKNGSSVFATVSSQHYWNRPSHDVFYQLGYSNGFRFGTYSVTAGRTRSSDGTLSNEIMVSTTIPLGHTQHAPMLTTNLSAGTGASGMQSSISGTAGENNQYSYNAYGSASKSSSADVDANGGVSGNWRAPYAQVTASASGGAHSSQVAAGVSGSVVAHPGGVTFSQTVGDTFGIVEAKGAAGASVSSATGVKVDSHGYAVVPFLTPYGMNTVDIDPKGSSTGVEFESTSEHVAPRLGSVVMLKYKTETGRAALIRAPQLSGEALPFGAEVTDGNGHNVGVVAQDSRIFARGLEESGTLVVKLGEQDGNVCRVQYSLPVATDKPGDVYMSLEGHCVGANKPVRADVGSAQQG
ncbi:fimbrial biogenesis outer membrane usher protein [Paraburkholderia sp. LEh10]|uniref:fimbria/pilus outer membrane usher protein n=1 Tax=Paraburkholderia sp. LEh10 TaxID=2821353 RepID=UPI001AEB3197|nr:fimbria/pilus outer membrane usher protein [Paraburkholderia sp. LEh10]MBP0592724.1 fimbrial biogenesis outer membrane usher protein [Paraburkholderia sp. LEh10]